MKKSIKLISTGLLVSLFIPIYSIANQTADQVSKPMDDKIQPTVEERIQMHEEMIKLHQDAISCLKSNKDPKECRKDFIAGMKKVANTYWKGHKKRHQNCAMD